MSTKIFTIPGTECTYAFNKQPVNLTPQQKKNLRLEVSKKLPLFIVPIHGCLVSNGKINLLISGVSGSGKTTLAKSLSVLGFKIIANDFVATWLKKDKLFAADINLRKINKHKLSLPIHHVCFLQPNDQRDLFGVSLSLMKSIYKETLSPLEGNITSRFLKREVFKKIFDLHFCLGNRQNPERWVQCIRNALSNVMPSKIGIIGLGTIGQDLTNLLVNKPWLSSLSLCSLNQDKLKSVILDLKSANPELSIRQVSNMKAIFEESNLVVLCFNQIDSSKIFNTTNERHRKILIHSEICQEIARDIREVKTFQGIILVVTNPVDYLSWYLYRESDLLASQIYGVGLGLDMKRLKTLTKRKFEVFGEHGDQIKIAKIKNKTLFPVNEPILLRQLKTYSNKIRNFTPRTRFGPAHEILSIIESFRKRKSTVRVSSISNDFYTGQTITLNSGIPTRKYTDSPQIQEALTVTKETFEGYKKMGKDHTIFPHR